MRQKLNAWIRVWLWALLVAGLSIPFARAQQPFDLSLPSGTIAHFDLAACPTGWTEFTSARGAYIVGLTNGGTANTLVGTALTNQENRPAGSHNHAITDPGHVHGGVPTFTVESGFDSAATFEINDSLASSTSSATTGITISAGGGGTSGQTGVAGTNGPYLQLLVCSKT